MSTNTVLQQLLNSIEIDIKTCQSNGSADISGLLRCKKAVELLIPMEIVQLQQAFEAGENNILHSSKIGERVGDFSDYYNMTYAKDTNNRTSTPGS